MANKLVSVDSGLNLPAAVQAQLQANLATGFASQVTAATTQAGNAATSAINAHVSEVNAAASAASAAAPTDTMVASLVPGPSSTKTALDAIYSSRSGLDINVWSYHPVGDGYADDTVAIQAAITAAGVGGKIHFGKNAFGLGRFNCSPLTMLSFQTWEGPTKYVGSGTGAAQVMLKFSSLTGSQVAITASDSCSINNMMILGPGSAVGAVTGISCALPTIRLNGCSVYSFTNALALAGVWYARISECEFVRNGIAMAVNNCYNLVIDGATRFNCLKDDGVTYGYGITTTGACMVKMMGGAIENYIAAYTLANYGIVSFFGVYFETGCANAVAILGTSVTGTTINLSGSEIYLQQHYGFVDITGCVDATLNASGNFFKCIASTTPAVPVAYRFSANPSADIHISGDNWKNVTLAGTLYMNNPGNYPRVSVSLPAQGIVNEGRTLIGKLKAQSLAVAGAVTIDASLGDAVVSLTANATSSSITNAVDGQILSVTFVQDATGGRTYTWPSTCRFAGGTAPSDTTASKRTIVTFRYDSFNGRWWELNRSVAVG